MATSEWGSRMLLVVVFSDFIIWRVKKTLVC